MVVCWMVLIRSHYCPLSYGFISQFCRTFLSPSPPLSLSFWLHVWAKINVHIKRFNIMFGTVVFLLFLLPPFHHLALPRFCFNWFASIHARMYTHTTHIYILFDSCENAKQMKHIHMHVNKHFRNNSEKLTKNANGILALSLCVRVFFFVIFVLLPANETNEEWDEWNETPSYHLCNRFGLWQYDAVAPHFMSYVCLWVRVREQNGCECDVCVF